MQLADVNETKTKHFPFVAGEFSLGAIDKNPFESREIFPPMDFFSDCFLVF